MKSKTGLKTTTALQVSSVIKMKKVLFVCTGNTCRSPMAEAIFNHIADRTAFTATSCGIFADGMSPICENAKLSLKEIGIDFSHVSRQISGEILNEADYIICMTENHARNIISSYPEFSDKVFVMPCDISDPYGGTLPVYRECRNEIEKSIKIIISVLSGENNG